MRYLIGSFILSHPHLHVKDFYLLSSSFYNIFTAFITVQAPFSLSEQGQSYIAHYKEFKEEDLKFTEKASPEGRIS